jgi:uncharacterized membrane protein
MTDSRSPSIRLDIALVIVSIAVLSVAVLIWMMAVDIARETVILAVTIALIISVILIFNVVVLVILRLQRRITHLEGVLTGNARPPQTDEPEVIVVTLTNTERRIINRLEENGGSMGQDELRRATGLSKSTLSVTLSTLERKAIISRVTSGRTKLVVLEKTVPR